MWSFANTLGSHSLHTKLKTHYSEQLHSCNNPLIINLRENIDEKLMKNFFPHTLFITNTLNLVHSEHLPQVDVQIHIMVVLRNTEWWVISI